MSRSGRYLARRCAVQALYQWDITAQKETEIAGRFIQNPNLEAQHREYFLTLIASIPDHIEEIDALITPRIDRKLADIDIIERAILRLATYELLYQVILPTNVIIDEAIELAKTFAAENSYKYVNGVLDKIAQEVRK